MPRIVVILGLIALASVAFVALEALSPPDAAPPVRPADPFEGPLPSGDIGGREPGGLPDVIGVADGDATGVGAVFGVVLRAADLGAVPDAKVTLWIGKWRQTVATDDGGAYRVDDAPAGEVRARVQSKDLVDSPVKTVSVAPGAESPLDFELEAGTELAGRVTDQGSGAAIEGALVRIRGRDAKVARTGTDGGYRLRGLGVGSLVVEAEANGYPVVRHPVTVGAGEDLVTRDFDLLRGGTIEGLVTDGAGLPIEGAKVLIRQIQERAVLSGSDGRFVLTAVPVNVPVRVEAEKDGFVPSRSDALKLRTDEVARDVVLRLSAGGRVTGRVLLADGSPAAGATIRVMPIRPQTSVVRIPSGKTDGKGEFVISPVAPGDHRLTAVVAGALSATTEVLGVREGGEVAGVEVRLGAALAISGVVADYAGKPVPKVFVTARPLNVQPGARFGSARTDEAGGFRILGLVKGVYRISVRPPNGGPEAAFAEVAAGATDVKLAMPSPGKVSGRVMLAGGEPVASFSIRIVPAEGAGAGGTVFRRVNDKNGEFAFTDLTPGTFTISASAAEGFSRPVAPIGVAPGGDVTGVVLVLDSGGRIVGRVVDERGAPLADARIFARGVEGDLQLNRGGVRTSASGEFEIDGLRSGAYDVTASVGTLVAVAEGVRVASGAEVRADLRMPASGSLVVTVRDGEGWPVESAVVHVRDAAGRFVPPAPQPISDSLPPAERPAAEREARRRAQVTDATGVSRRVGVPEGEVTVRVAAHGFSDVERQVDVKGGGTAEVGITLVPGTSGMDGEKSTPERVR